MTDTMKNEVNMLLFETKMNQDMETTIQKSSIGEAPTFDMSSFNLD